MQRRDFLHHQCDEPLVDDLTLTTEDVTSMKGLFQRVYDYCQWTGVNTNTQTYSTTRIDMGDTVGTVVHHQLFCSISALGRRVVAAVGECGMAGTT